MPRPRLRTLAENQKIKSDALFAIDYSKKVRKKHARRTNPNNLERRSDIKVAQDFINKAMKPIRSEIAKYPYLPASHMYQDQREMLLELSDGLKKERLALWKMSEKGVKSRRKTARKAKAKSG